MVHVTEHRLVFHLSTGSVLVFNSFC